MNDDTSNNKLYRNLSILLKLFRNRPNHLAKYLIENNAFSKEFIHSIIASKKLNDMETEAAYNYFIEETDLAPIYFSNFDDMDKFYANIIEDRSSLIDIQELSRELNHKLQKCLEDERYEEASMIRDYMKVNNISINI